jgi:hypothetical protein
MAQCKHSAIRVRPENANAPADGSAGAGFFRADQKFFAVLPAAHPRTVAATVGMRRRLVASFTAPRPPHVARGRLRVLVLLRAILHALLRATFGSGWFRGSRAALWVRLLVVVRHQRLLQIALSRERQSQTNELPAAARRVIGIAVVIDGIRKRRLNWGGRSYRSG